MKNRYTKGFTLIELMIVLVVAAILAAVALPSYQQQIRKTRRADTKVLLLELAQYMERNYTEANRYDQSSGGAAINLPFTEAPKDGSSKFYDLQFQAGTLIAQAYTLEAVPKNGQQKDTLCGTLRIDHTGVKTITGTANIDSCWGS